MRLYDPAYLQPVELDTLVEPLAAQDTRFLLTVT